MLVCPGCGKDRSLYDASGLLDMTENCVIATVTGSELVLTYANSLRAVEDCRGNKATAMIEEKRWVGSISKQSPSEGI